MGEQEHYDDGKSKNYSEPSRGSRTLNLPRVRPLLKGEDSPQWANIVGSEFNQVDLPISPREMKERIFGKG